MGEIYSSGGSATARFHEAVTDARAGATATVESAPNGTTRIVGDVDDEVRDATDDGAHRDAKELVQEKARDGVAALLVRREKTARVAVIMHG